MNVGVVIEGVEALTEAQLVNLTENLRSIFRALDPAPVYWPLAKEVGVQFQITEESFGELLQPDKTSAAS